MKLPLSIAIIASNEEDHIGRCLCSVTSIASEIIVIENDSVDKTCDIAQSLGAKIFHEDWKGFSAQKNLAIKRTSQPWILCLDADEELDDVLLCSITKFITEDDKRYNGAYFSRRTFFMNRWIKHGDWFPDYVTRLFRMGYGEWSSDQVHEKLIIRGCIKRLSGNLLHYSYRSLTDHMYKNLKYAELGVTFKNRSWINIFLRTFWKFFRGYFLQLGFLDGFAGLYIALTQGFFTMHKHALQKEFFDKKRNSCAKSGELNIFY